MMTVAEIDGIYKPPPTASPTPATDHTLAAVVRPRITWPRASIAPAPRKPMPDTTCAATRDGSRVTCSPSASENPYMETIMISAEPTHTSICVRSPAAQDNRSRSNPITLPSTADMTSLPTSSSSDAIADFLVRFSCIRNRPTDARFIIDFDCDTQRHLLSGSRDRPRYHFS